MEPSTDNSGHDLHANDVEESHTNHREGFYKGLIALLGIYVFFFMERLFTLFTSARKKHKTKPKRNSREVCSSVYIS